MSDPFINPTVGTGILSYSGGFMPIAANDANKPIASFIPPVPCTLKQVQVCDPTAITAGQSITINIGYIDLDNIGAGPVGVAAFVLDHTHSDGVLLLDLAVDPRKVVFAVGTGSAGLVGTHLVNATLTNTIDG